MLNMEAIPGPPDVANAAAMQALAVVDVDDAATPMDRVTQALSRREIAKGLLFCGFITQDEYTQVYLGRVTGAAAADGAGPANGGLLPPAWFGPAIAAALAPNNSRLDLIAAQQTDLNAQQADLSAALVDLTTEQARFIEHQPIILSTIINIDARQTDSVALDMTDTLSPLRNSAGIKPPNFPPTLGLLNSLTDPELAALLQHYGIQGVGNVEEIRRRLKTFIGIRP